MDGRRAVLVLLGRDVVDRDRCLRRFVIALLVVDRDRPEPIDRHGPDIQDIRRHTIVRRHALEQIDRILRWIRPPSRRSSDEVADRINLTRIAELDGIWRHEGRQGDQRVVQAGALALVPIRRLETAGAGLRRDGRSLDLATGGDIGRAGRVDEGANDDKGIARTHALARQGIGPRLVDDQLDEMVLVDDLQGLEPTTRLGQGDSHGRGEIEHATRIGRVAVHPDDLLLVDRGGAGLGAQPGETAGLVLDAHHPVGFRPREIAGIDRLGGKRRGRSQQDNRGKDLPYERDHLSSPGKRARATPRVTLGHREAMIWQELCNCEAMPYSAYGIRWTRA